MIICAKPGEIRHTLLPFKCYFIHMIVKDEALAALLMKLPNYIPLEERFEAERLFREIADAYSTGLYEDSLLLYSRLFALLYLLSAHLTEETAKTGQSHKEMIEGVIGFIKENLTSDLSLEKVAAYASFSPIHFHNCFKRSTGKTLREFVEEARLHRAVELLVGTDMTLSEIAYAAYEITIKTSGADQATVDRISALLQNGPLTVTKKSKSGEREVDVREFLKHFEIALEEGVIRLQVTLAAGEGNFLSPELIVTALRTHAGILSGNPLEECYRILRRRVLLEDGVTDFR